MLKYRVISSVVLLLLFFLLLFKASLFYFTIVITLLMLIAAWEWSGLSGYSSWVGRLTYTIIYCGVIYLVARHKEFAQVILVLAVMAWLWFFAAIRLYSKDKGDISLNMQEARAVTGFVVLAAAWLGIIMLRTFWLDQPAQFLYILLIVWSIDTGAYFSGLMLGKHAFAPRISPKKTWEGFCGGIVLSSIVVVLGYFFMNINNQSAMTWFILSLVAMLVSIYGDLSISLLKRIANIKDSSQLIPGHGELLDRLDSIMPAFLVFTLYVFYR